MLNKHRGPLVSVILPVYNAESTVGDSIQSILNQTYKNFEFIIINDGSIDGSDEVIKEFQTKDHRIQYYLNDKNRGLIYTLNRGLDLAKGKYLARMDSDDVSLAKRLEVQIKVMEEKPDVVVCGCNIRQIGDNSKTIEYPELDEEIKKHMLLACPFAHPSVMIRSDILKDNNICYNTDYKDAEDYKMWVDLSKYGEFYNIQQVLLKYRISDTQITQTTNLMQKQSARKSRREYLMGYLGNTFNIPEVITLSYLKTIYNPIKKNDRILSLFLLSLNEYNVKFVLFYLTSFVWVRCDTLTNMRIIKRIIKGPDSLI